MSYENAPSTRLLATHCACCGRPLRDANSVEIGIGPDCRAKYGFNDPALAADWIEATLALEAVPLSARKTDLVGLLGDRVDARGAVNRLVHAFAAHSTGLARAAIATACRALGYPRLADRLSEVVASVQVKVEDGAYAVSAPYIEGAGSDWYAAGGRWDREAKVWRVPQACRKAPWNVLRRLFAGQIGNGPQGLFTI